MAIAAWPATVPAKPVVNGLTLASSYQDPIMSETEGGPALMRPRHGPRATEMTWQSTLLTRAQWSTLETFLRVDLRHGTLPFTMPVFRPYGCMVTRVCRLKTGAWQTDASAASRFRVSFSLIVFNW